MTENKREKPEYKIFDQHSGMDIKKDTFNKQKNFAFYRVAMCKENCNINVNVTLDMQAENEKRRLYKINKNCR